MTRETLDQMLKNGTKRIEWCDIFKGMAILLIVIAHVSGRFNDYVYQFHVAAFFFISGYTNKGQGSLFEAVVKKALTLLLPYYFLNLAGLAVIDVLEKLGIAGFICSGVYHSDLQWKIMEALRLGGTNCEWFGATWYLVVMFWAACLFDIEIRLAKRNKACLMLMSICLFLLSLSMAPPTWVQALKAQYYMTLGWLLKNILKEGKLSWTILKACIIAVIWVIMTNMGLCDTMNWPTFKFNGMADMIMPLFGILILVYLSQAIADLGRIKKPLLYLGRNTMSVMCLHFLGFKPAYLVMTALGRMSWSQFNLAVPPDIYYMTDIIFITAVSVAASLMMWKLLGHFRTTRLLTGRWSREELSAFCDSLLIKELHNIYDIAENIGTGIIKGYRADFRIPWKN